MNEVELFDALCRENFDAFAARAFEEVNPGIKYEWNWHINCVAEHLQALYENRLPDGKKRLCINVPPRTLKSFLGSIAFPAWVIGKESNKKFIATSFNATLAKEMSQKSRILIESDWYQKLFPNMRLDPRQNEKNNFWTTQRGMYYSSAIMSVTGRGADFVILDDPINPKEAYSDTIRNEVNSTISSTIPTRFNDLRFAYWLMIMQRLHEDDPTGHFALNDDRWYVLKLPGENLEEHDISYTLGDKTWTLKRGELLFPARLTRKVLDDLRTDMLGNYPGQILQSPVPLGGGEFQEQWINYYPNGSIKPKDMNIYILVDPSGGDEINKKKKKNSDWTAMMVVGLAPDNNYYLLDVLRDRLNPTERIDMLFILHRKWNALAGKPAKVGYEKYGMMTDTHYIKDKMASDTYHFTLVELGGTMQKEERIRRLIPDLQNGRWFFPDNLIYVDAEGRQFDLIKELVKSEMPNFPRARFDDMLDALSRIYEDSLNKIFPQIEPSAVQKAYNTHQEQDWDDY